MTLPIERTRAVIELAKEVRALAPYVYGKGETVRMPRELLRRLHAWLRHYPEPSELTVTAKLAPHLWAAAGPGYGRVRKPHYGAAGQAGGARGEQ